MADRIELHKKLCEILGSKNVYYQPPEGLKMAYPCIVYSRSKPYTAHADNKKYIHKRRYTITLIDKRPESSIADAIESLPYCEFDRVFETAGLNHFVYLLYF